MEIHIISGFLGAGKTSLLKKLIPQLKGKTVIIENEFGDVGLDGDLVRDSGISIREVTSGCICCSLQMEFQKAIHEIIESYDPDQIIIEPSGIGKLSDVVKACELVKKSRDLDLEIKHKVTIVDATLFHEYREDFGAFYLDQIKNANIICFSFIDEITNHEFESLRFEMQEINPFARIYRNDWFQEEENELYNFIKENYDSPCKTIEEDLIGEDSLTSQEDQIFDALDFESYYTLAPKTFYIQDLKGALNDLKTGNYGQALRAKGLILDPEGNKYEFNFTPANMKVEMTNNPAEVKLVVIGNRLDKQGLNQLFEGRSNE